MDNDVRTEIIKTVPPASVSVITALGITLSDWVLILTIAYLVAQISWLGMKMYSHWKKEGT